MHSWFNRVLLMLSLIGAATGAAFALDFAAEVADVDGKATVTQKATGKSVPAVKGMKLAPGDTIETGAGGELELLYDDGNVTRIDESTTITIARMSLEKDKSKQTILELAVGKVKNSVSKLPNPQSKFEVHSKTAVAGVTGTPPWTMGAFGPPGGKQRVEVDLLPDGGKNHTQGVFVRGSDPKSTMVNLSPGMRTTAFAGAPPVRPIPISPARLQQLQASMPITTPPEKQQEKKQELEQKIEKEVKGAKEEPKEEAKKEEEKKKDEDKKEEKKEEKQEEKKEDKAKEETKQEEPKQEEPKREEAKHEEAPKEEPKAGGKEVDAIGGVDASAPAGGETFSKSADIGTSGSEGGAMMDHLTSNVSTGPVDPGKQVTSTGDAGGASSLPGASQDSLPAVTRVRVQVNITNK